MKKTDTGDDDNWFSVYLWVTLIYIGGDDDACDYDDDGEEDEDYNAFDATPRQKSDKLSVSRVTRLTNHARWGMKMVNHHPSFFEHFEAHWLEMFYTWCV